MAAEVSSEQTSLFRVVAGAGVKSSWTQAEEVAEVLKALVIGQVLLENYLLKYSPSGAAEATVLNPVL